MLASNDAGISMENPWEISGASVVVPRRSALATAMMM